MAKAYGQFCPIAKTLDIIGDRWTLLIVRDLLRGKTKFHELLESLPGIASNILSDRLKQLEESEVVTRRFYSDHPPRAEYTLTEKGVALRFVTGTLAYWGSQYGGARTALVDTRCGHEIVPAFYCPDCGDHVPRGHVRLAPKAAGRTTTGPKKK